MKANLFNSDLCRYGRENETLLQKMDRPESLKFLYVFRKRQAASNPISRAYYGIRLRKMTQRTQIQIPASTKIGAGFYIGHTGRIIVNQKAILGKNVNIATGVTIGQENRGKRQGTPTIGDNVWIGTNSVIVGNVKIGNDVLIAPNSFVNMDVPPHSIVIGNPARIIHRENATEGYISNAVE